MTSGANWVLEDANGALVVRGQRLRTRNDAGELAWNLVALDKDRVLLCGKDAQQGMAGFDDGLAKCSVSVFTDFLLGCNRRGLTGVVSVDTGRGVKKIFFTDGNISFAASNLIDDRLGEVIYRAGMITLDQMADSAVKVTRATKFGKVLLNSRVFSTVDLWEALKLQVMEIVRSVFLVNHVYFQVQTGANLAPTSVVFDIATDVLIDECASFGSMFRAFVQRLGAGSTVSVEDKHDFWREPDAGTFVGDMVGLVRQAGTLKDIVEQSKLNDINTYATLFMLANRRVFLVDEVKDAPQPLPPQHCLSSLKALLDAYAMLLKSSRAAFATEKLAFPVPDLMRFAADLNPKGFITLCVGMSGEITRESVMNLYAQTAHNPAATPRVVRKLRGLIQFLLQVTMDLLPGAQGGEVRKQFLELMT